MAKKNQEKGPAMFEIAVRICVDAAMAAFREAHLKRIAGGYEDAIRELADRSLGGGAGLGDAVLESLKRVNARFEAVTWREGADDDDLLEINTDLYFEALYCAIAADCLACQGSLIPREHVAGTIRRIDWLNDSIAEIFPEDCNKFMHPIHYQTGEFPLALRLVETP